MATNFLNFRRSSDHTNNRPTTSRGQTGLLGALCCIATLLPASSGASQSPPPPYELIVLDGGRLKWDLPVSGVAAAVTYSVVAVPREFDGARNCQGIVPLSGILASAAATRSAFDRELKAAFAAWSAIADISFHQVNSAEADILIGAQAQPRGRAFTNVDFDRTEPSTKSGVRSLRRSVICLNPNRPWKIGFDGNLNVYDLRYTLMHEIGHAIGLDHPGAESELMDFRYTEAFRSPQAGDIAGASALYGPGPQQPAHVSKARSGNPATANTVALGGQKLIDRAKN